MTMPVGSIVHLTSCIIKTKISAETTMPDTPDMYGAELEIMDDRGALNTSALAGQQGSDGQVTFAFRQQTDISVKTLSDLPTGFGTADIGKYYVINQDVIGLWNATTNNPHLADGTGVNGHAYRVSVAGTIDLGDGPISFLENDYVVYNGSRWEQRGLHNSQWAWVWWGSDWRKTFMGSEGPAGPIPKIQPSAALIDPALDSFVDTSGTTLVPSWRFNLAVQPGPEGAASRLSDMPDFDSTKTPGANMVLMCSNNFSDNGYALWEPANVLALSPRVYSIPESAFSSHIGTFSNWLIGIGADQNVNIATFQLPAQPFDWTPVVWGHIAGTNQIDTGVTFTSADQTANPGFFEKLIADGINIAQDILGKAITAPVAGLESLQMRIGCRVMLGSAQHQISRGFGNARGEVNLVPHYSTPGKPTRNITPTNNYTVIKANHAAATADAAASATTAYGTFTSVIGNGSSTSIAVTHNLASANITAKARLVSNGADVPCTVTQTSNNVVTLGFDSAPVANSVRCIVNRGPVYQSNAEAVLNVELHNDGVAGLYNFSPINSQILVMVVPIDAYASYATTPITRRVQ